MDPSADKKPILDLALELGVRTETLQQAMQDMGLSADAAASFDADEEAVLIEQLVSTGVVAENLIKGKGRRKLSDEPVIDDDILTEALGASESGFSDENVPRQILFESSFEKKPFLQRLFSKKKDIVNSLAESSFSPEDLESIFTAPSEREQDREQSPFQEIEDQDSKSKKKVVEQPTEPLEEASVDKSGDDDELSREDLLAAGISAEDLDEIEEIDESLLGDIDGVDIDDSDLDDVEGLDDISADDLENLSDIPEDENLEIDEEIEALAGEEGLDEMDIELDEADLEGVEDEDGVLDDDDDEDEDEYVPGFIEKIFARIQLTQQEMWTIMIGSLAIMMLLLGVTVYWWLYTSPVAKGELYEEAKASYEKAIIQNVRYNDNKILWNTPRVTLQKTISLYKDFIRRFDEDPRLIIAYENMCECYRFTAIGDKKEGKDELSDDSFRQMASYYEKYLALLERESNKMVGGDNPADAFPDIIKQRDALLNIANAKRELKQYEAAIKSLEDFVERFRQTTDALEAMVDIGDTYQQWADVKTDRKLELLGKATTSYTQALRRIPADDHEKRMDLYAKIGDVRKKLYDNSIENKRDDEANQFLGEVIANYEKGEAEGSQIDTRDMQPKEFKIVTPKIQQVAKKLGDLYLLRGREAGKQWKEFEDTAEPYPDAIAQKQQLLDAADRERITTENYLKKANVLYDKLLLDSELLDKDDYEDILYNKADCFYIVRDYPKAITAGEELLIPKRAASDEAKTKILYLLGHSAWEDAKETLDYTKVKDYYSQALKMNNLYPPEQNGKYSHLADIRLINSYYLYGENKQYQQAIDRFDAMIDRYPKSGYTFLSVYFYADTLEQFGDDLSARAKKLEDEAVDSSNANSLLGKARKLREKARAQYKVADTQYEKAIIARDYSEQVDTQNQRFLKQIMYNQGHNAFKAGEWQKAEGYFKKAFEKFAKDKTSEEYLPPAIERMGDINIQLTNYSQAVRYYKEYLDKAYENNDMRVSKKLADTYIKQYSWDKARQEYNKIVSNDLSVPSKSQVDRLLKNSGKAKKGPGFESLKKIAHSYWSEALYNYDDRDAKIAETLKAYQNLASKYPLNVDNMDLPDDKDSLRMIGMINFELQNYQDAIRSYEAFLDKDPQFSRKGQISYRIGQAYIKLGNFDKAIEVLTQISEASLDNSMQYADMLILLGQAYQNKADYIKANEADDEMYRQYLKRAQRIYSRVALTNQPAKIREASTLSAAIESMMQNQQEFSTVAPG